MYSKESLQAMTVVELRKIARENSISLSAGISKQGIVDRLTEVLVKDEAAAPAQSAAPATPAKRTAAIVADDDDPPVLTPNMPFNRSSAPAAPRQPLTPPSSNQPTVNRGNVPGTNKPVFSLEGVRAWHNPRSYQQPAATGYNQPRPQSPYGQSPYGQQRPMQRSTTTVSRFGPAAASDTPVNNYSAPDPYRSEARPQMPAQSANEARPVNNYSSYQNEYRSRPAAPTSANALPDLLAAGDITSGHGMLEIQSEGHGYLRTGNFLPGNDDIYVSNAQVRRFHLRSGDLVHGKVRPRREDETLAMLLYITEINGVDAQDIKETPAFETLTATYPTQQILISGHSDCPWLSAANEISPIGLGQRLLVNLPENADKGALLQALAAAISESAPKAKLLTLLLAQRPEDVTLARESLKGEVVYTTFDTPDEDALRIASLSLQHARRMAERKHDVVILLDSLTALCAMGKDATEAAKKLFGSARALREGGSLTVIALSEDTAINFKRYANAVWQLSDDGELDAQTSFTLHAESMLKKDE